MEGPKDVADSSAAGKRVIKRYSNRKLYDTKDSRYVTLQQIGEMIRRGEDVQIIDNKTKEDKTEVTLALILSEDLKSKPRSIPLGALRDLLQERGERLLSQLREGPIGRLIPGAPNATGDEEAAPPSRPSEPDPLPPSTEPDPSIDEKPRGGRGFKDLVESSRQTFDQLLSPTRDLRQELEALTRRVETLETLVAELMQQRRDK